MSDDEPAPAGPQPTPSYAELAEFVQQTTAASAARVSEQVETQKALLASIEAMVRESRQAGDALAKRLEAAATAQQQRQGEALQRIGDLLAALQAGPPNPPPAGEEEEPAGGEEGDPAPEDGAGSSAGTDDESAGESPGREPDQSDAATQRDPAGGDRQPVRDAGNNSEASASAEAQEPAARTTDIVRDMIEDATRTARTDDASGSAAAGQSVADSTDPAGDESAGATRENPAAAAGDEQEGAAVESEPEPGDDGDGSPDTAAAGRQADEEGNRPATDRSAAASEQDDAGAAAAAGRTEDPPPAQLRSEGEVARLLETIETKLAESAPSREVQQEILEDLGRIRARQEEQHRIISAAMVLSQPPAGAEEMPSAWEALQDLHGRLDQVIRILRPANAPAPETAMEPATIPRNEPRILPVRADVAPTDVVAIDADEVREATATLVGAANAQRRGFARFAWIALLVVFLAAGALGGIAQQQFALLALPDATNGWKDRVWETTGEEIARCIAASSAVGGACAVTVEAAAGATPP